MSGIMPKYEYLYEYENEQCMGHHVSLQWAISAALNHLKHGSAKPLGIWGPDGKRIYSGDDLLKMYPGRLEQVRRL